MPENPGTRLYLKDRGKDAFPKIRVQDITSIIEVKIIARIFGPRLYFTGTNLYFIGTDLYHIGTDSYLIDTELYLTGTHLYLDF